MDSTHFDSLARVVGAWTTRRSALALLAGLGLGSLDAAQTTARKSGTCKPACTECSSCKKGKCKKRNGTKRCKKGACEPLTAGTSCTVPSDGGTCQNGACTCCSGECVNTQRDEANCGACGTACSANQVCQRGICFPTGACPATTAGLCIPDFIPCSAPENGCSCGRSTDDNVVCVTILGAADCGTPCTDSPTCPSCTTDADCAAGSACVDASGVGCGCPAGFRLCLPQCPAPVPAREAAAASEGIGRGLLAP